ncbi:MAG: undecaprenyl-phosphate glucose phosphotransferase [Cryomorphaceae bacterium]|nr:undecaprenyl-phosphate glucose phosphotransferase [Flavobacteriales bacterium]
MEYRYATFFKYLNALFDGILLASIILAFEFIIAPYALESAAISEVRFHVFIIGMLWFFATSRTKLYNQVLTNEAVPFLKRTFRSLLLFTGLILLLNVVLPGLLMDLSSMMFFVGIYAVSLFMGKILFLYLRRVHRKYWVDYNKTIILGSGSVCREIYDHFSVQRGQGSIIAGYFSDEKDRNLPSNLPYLGKPEEALKYAEENGISEVFSVLAPDKVGELKSMMQEADRRLIQFKFVPDLMSLMDKNAFLEYYGSLPILSIRKEPLQTKVNEIVKQAFDYVFASMVVIFVLSWMIPIIGLAIKLESRGPVFFRQLRSGKDNRPFFCLKFRSMVVNEASDSVQAKKDDARITRVGAFLRKTNLDEFPQFINVLLGDMSIVGPRPHMLKHTEDYSQVIDDFMVRHKVNPGITGWAQVNGLRGETKAIESMAKRVKADIWYLENWSFLLDVKIVFLTMIQTLKGNENAY